MSRGFCLAYYQTSFHTVVTVQVGEKESDQSIDSSDKSNYALIPCWTALASLMKTGHRPLTQSKKHSPLFITSCFCLICALRFMNVNSLSCASRLLRSRI